VFDLVLWVVDEKWLCHCVVVISFLPFFWYCWLCVVVICGDGKKEAASVVIALSLCLFCSIDGCVGRSGMKQKQ
jgi:hypothetical protein